MSAFVQTVTSLQDLDSAEAARLAAGCASLEEPSPNTRLQTPTAEDTSVLIFTSSGSIIGHGWFPNNAEILYKPENCYWLQFYGSADAGK